MVAANAAPICLLHSSPTHEKDPEILELSTWCNNSFTTCSGQATFLQGGNVILNKLKDLIKTWNKLRTNRSFQLSFQSQTKNYDLTFWWRAFVLVTWHALQVDCNLRYHANQESSSSLIQILKHTCDVYSSGRFSVPINCEMLIYKHRRNLVLYIKDTVWGDQLNTSRLTEQNQILFFSFNKVLILWGFWPSPSIFKKRQIEAGDLRGMQNFACIPHRCKAKPHLVNVQQH